MFTAPCMHIKHAEAVNCTATFHLGHTIAGNSDLQVYIPLAVSLSHRPLNDKLFLHTFLNLPLNLCLIFGKNFGKGPRSLLKLCITPS